MTVNFNPRTAALRDPFTAFAADEASVEMLRAVAIEFGWAPERVQIGGLRSAVQALSVAASPTVLFVDLSESADPRAEIDALAEVCEPGTIVVAAGMVNDVRFYRELIGAGLHEYLLKPFDADQLRETFNQALFSLVGPKPGDHAVQDRPHLMTAVIGVRGGVGASSLATSLAWLFADKLDRSTALLDLDVHFGTGALCLDLEPGRGLTDAIENPSRIDGLFIERAMVKAHDKLAVLSAEAPINNPILTDGQAFALLEEEMKSAFECTVIDLPRSVLVHNPHLLHDVHTVLLVTELTLAGARDAIRILSWLKSHAPGSGVLVVANRVVPGTQLEISRKDFETSIERKVDIVVPLDGKLAAQAAKLGKPLAEVAKSGKTGQALSELAEQLVRAVDGGASASAKKGARGGSLVGKIGSLRGLLAPKKAG